MISNEMKFRIFEILTDEDKIEILNLFNNGCDIPLFDLLDTVADLHNSRQISVYSEYGKKRLNSKDICFTDYIKY